MGLSVLLLVLAPSVRISRTTSIPPQNGSCPSDASCTCSDSKLQCTGLIPYVVPKSVKQVVLSQISLADLIPGRFCYESWNHVTTLIILVTPNADFVHLSTGVFACLEHVKEFRLSSEFLKHFSVYTFSGLSNVSVFDMSDCRHIAWNDLVETLSIDTNLPNLTHLILSKAGILEDLWILNETIVRHIYVRPINYLDLSYTNLVFDFDSNSGLCQSLLYLSVAGAQLHYTDTFDSSRVCNSLQIFDNSDDMNLRKDFRDVHCKNNRLTLEVKVGFFRAIRVARYNRIITRYENFEMSNCTWRLFPSKYYLKEFYFSSNFLPNFDSVLHHSRLELIDLSSNEMKNVNQNIFKHLFSLVKLYVSNNSLSKTNSFQDTFSSLFKHNRHLEVLDLSFNKLTYLPMDTFVTNTHMKVLNLSLNLFGSITFTLSSMQSLTILDLRNNSIKSLDQISRKSLDNLYEKQRWRHNTSSIKHIVQVFLEGNPFLCVCESLVFLQWFNSSPLFSATRQNHYCKLDGRNFQMTEAAIDAAKNDCARAKRKKMIELLLSTLLPTCIAVFIITTIVLYRKRKKRLIERRLQDGIQRLRENRSQFPVFLSYSSDDSDFVKLHVLQQFQYHLQFLTGLERELVCNADDHFHPARTIMSEIFRCLRESEVFVAVVSENYCTSRFCRYEIEHAHLLKKPIILIFKEHVEEDNMNLVTREVFETFTRVQFLVEDGQYRIQPDWPQICESIMQLVT